MDRAEIEQARTELAAGLPPRVTWRPFGGAWTLDFTRVQSELLPGTTIDLVGGSVDPTWANLYLFGEESFDGGASPALGIHLPTGEVRGLDVERDLEAVFFLNSSVRHFIATFQLLDRAFRLGELRMSELAPLLEVVDPNGFPRSEWRDLVADIETSSPEDALLLATGA